MKYQQNKKNIMKGKAYSFEVVTVMLKLNVEKLEEVRVQMEEMRDERIKKGLKIQGNNKIVVVLNALHLLENSFEDKEEEEWEVLKANVKSAGSAKRMAEGGCFLVYNKDIVEHLNYYLGMNPNTGKTEIIVSKYI